MEIFSFISEGFIKGFAKSTAELLIKQFKNEKQFRTELEDVQKDLPNLLFNHYSEIIRWSANIPFYGLSSPKSVESSSIPLIISSTIKRFSSHKKKFDILDEVDLFLHSHHYLILGSPGAGKTTTLKRIILNYFLNKAEWNYSYPILIRLRTIKQNENLYTKLLDTIGVPHKIILKRDEKTKEIIDKFVAINETNSLNFIIDLLSNTKCLLLLDGLDELHPNIKDEVYDQIETLGLNLRNSKILLTSRTGEYHQLFSNFHLCELQPLSTSQIKKISQNWLKSNKAFLNELNQKPYKDIANRPIFLTFLLVLFEHYLELPTQPSDVYRDITNLIIKDWDEEHRGNIVRLSKYSNFNRRRKFLFISEIAYLLTYKIKTNVFNSKQLEEVYLLICNKYGLPQEESRQVVREIESHNGIIAESFDNKFEFSHLSIQEYLTAEHIVTLPFSQETISYFQQYPEPLAVAVSISRDPTQWFSFLILNNHIKKIITITSLNVLITRLLIEKPSFRASEELGYTALFVIKLYYEYYKEEKQKNIPNSIFHDFISYPFVIESIKMAIENYNIEKQELANETEISFHIKHWKLNEYFISFPPQISLDEDTFHYLFNKKYKILPPTAVLQKRG